MHYGPRYLRKLEDAIGSARDADRVGCNRRLRLARLGLRPEAGSTSVPDTSSLDDADLLILDFLWDKIAAPSLLRRSAYSFHMNIRWSHDLDDTQLVRRLSALLASELIAWTAEGLLQLTSEGGAEWERERTPLWASYVWDRGTYDESWGEETVMSPASSTAESFIRCAVESRLYGGPLGAWK